MLYLIALVAPPLAVLLAGKPFQMLLNGFFWLAGLVLALLFVGWPLIVLSMAYAVLVVHNHYADRRTARLLKAATLRVSYREVDRQVGGVSPAGDG